MNPSQRDVQKEAPEVLGLGDSQHSGRIFPIAELRQLELDGSWRDSRFDALARRGEDPQSGQGCSQSKDTSHASQGCLPQLPLGERFSTGLATLSTFGSPISWYGASELTLLTLYAIQLRSPVRSR